MRRLTLLALGAGFALRLVLAATLGASYGIYGPAFELQGVDWRQADAMQLPFDEGAFDAVVCQFGAMFLPDKGKAFGEARRGASSRSRAGSAATLPECARHCSSSASRSSWSAW